MEMSPLSPAWKDHRHHIVEQDVQEKCHSDETGKNPKCQVSPSFLWTGAEGTSLEERLSRVRGPGD